MKRNHFLASLLLVAANPFKTFAKVLSPFRILTKGFKIAAGEGRIHGHLRLGGPTLQIVDVKVSGSDTNGDWAVFEQTVLTRGAGVRLHIHPGQDEMFYVLEGAYRFKMGDEIFDLQAGDSIFLPRNVPHAWITISEKAKSHILVQPAGKLEDFFLAIAAIDPNNRPTPEEMDKLSADHEMTVVGPPLTLE